MFNPAEYARLIEQLKSTHKVTTELTKPRSRSGPRAIVRHDVDVSPRHAQLMSKLDKSLGIQSFFCFLVTSPFYGISNDVTRIIREIKDDGHTIGLHYDPGSDLSLQAQVRLIREIVPDVACYSIHSPTTSWGFIDSIGSCKNLATLGYQYWSDSLMTPRYPIAEALEAEFVHLLFHPEHWAYGYPTGYEQSFREAAYQRRLALDVSLRDFLDGCQQSLANRENDEQIGKAMQ